MGISFNSESRQFHLQAKDTSYVMGIERDGFLLHLYWGKKIKAYRNSNFLQLLDRGFSGNPYKEDRTFSLDTLPQEYPQYGTTDFRKPAYHVQLENGSTVTDLRYESHRIFKGKEPLDGLPATYVENENEAETLEITMVDTTAGLKVLLTYTVFENFNVITRSTRFVNKGKQSLKLLSALSMSVDFRDADFEFLHLHGAHVKERHIERLPLRHGIQSIESTRGASSHQHNPFIALLRKGTAEETGEVYAFNFVYSGNFLAQAEVDQFSTTRVTMGINPFDFNWTLGPSNTFQTPEVVMVFSSEGLGGMSRTFHDLYRTRLVRGKFRDAERPVLVNNWEATYFDFNAEKILDIVEVGAELGIELFVLDDGWFGKRNNDKTSLGDWFVNKEKLPEGLGNLAEKVRSKDMQFGLWFEPEMVSVDSELYRNHPDWCLHVPGRQRSESRNQLILDFSREDVCEEVIRMVSDILSSVPISYVKWDMNRHMTEIGSALLPADRQRETAHRYMLGLYRVMEHITSAFPDILFESCSGGGGRFDPGILYYMPQTWTSDNTDAVSRLKIQYGTSLVYPIISMGSHVSAVPNHQVNRITSIKMRGDVAMSGNLGYELDLTKLTDEEKEAVKEQVATYKQIRKLIQFGNFYRLKSPFEGNETAWLFVNEDKSEAIVYYFRTLEEPAAPLRYLRLTGINTDKTYQIAGTDSFYGGDELSYVGLSIPTSIKGDFQSYVWHLKEIK
ncbi:alpha-galactosidase [Fictibacillus enclensis]|uniref:Alpha-galactosidase n=1 Tax=Fictibacillus enclensis TaxID=1017270 RepID=A0A0V8J599_9BACL|nr:alpha-galactosidase [Fictibacillus enclensis]KSU82091.1 alpha-galactosidase [Fictibacillus enclensis]SCC30164.1 alpha-galactosidase [Fictibacillus enclensis]